MRRLAGGPAAGLLMAACGGGHEDDPLSKTTLTKLETTDVKAGTGAEARQGRRVSVHYTGWLYHPAKPDHKGRKFDSSRDRGQPIDSTLGPAKSFPAGTRGSPG